MKKFMVVLACLCMSGIAQATHLPIVVLVPANVGYVPRGFDDNDRAQLMVEGLFEDTCMRVGRYRQGVDFVNHKIYVTLSAYRYNGVCLDVQVPFSLVIDLGILPAGEYTVEDTFSGNELGKLPVKVARNDGPDDYLYAPISDARLVEQADGSYNVSVNGIFNLGCMKFKDIKVVREGENVITVLPIAEKTDGGCMPGQYLFEKSVPVGSLTGGRYLLHVRSLNGAAINKLVEIKSAQAVTPKTHCRFSTCAATN